MTWPAVGNYSRPELANRHGRCRAPVHMRSKCCISAYKQDEQFVNPTTSPFLTLMKPLRPLLANAGYDSSENRTVAKLFDAIPVIARNPRRGRNVWQPRLPYYEKRWSVEHIFSRLKEELGLKMVKVRGLWRVTIHMSISAIAMLSIAITALRLGRRELMTRANAFKF